MQIQWAVEIFRYERSITRAAKKLRLRILAEQKIDLDERTCKSRIYSAIDFFSVDNNVSIKVWEEVFADYYADIGKLAIHKGDLKMVKICADAQKDCLRRAAEAAEIERDWAPVFIISPDIDPEDLGFQRRKLKEIARKHNEGYYLRLIESFPIEPEEKKRLLQDAQITDIEYEQINTD